MADLLSQLRANPELQDKMHLTDDTKAQLNAFSVNGLAPEPGAPVVLNPAPRNAVAMDDQGAFVVDVPGAGSTVAPGEPASVVPESKQVMVDVAAPQPAAAPVARGPAPMQARTVSTRGFRNLQNEAAASEQQATQGLEEAQGQKTAALEAQRDAGLQQIEADQEQARQEVELQTELNEKLLKAEDQRARRMQREREEEEASLDRLESSMKAFEDFEIDPQRFWKGEDGTTNFGKKIGGAIAMAFGAFGEAFTGRNTALDIINNAIDRDIASQREQKDSLAKGAQNRRTLLGELREKHDNDEEAFTAYKISALEQAKRQASLMATKAKIPGAQIKAQELMAQIDTQIADEAINGIQRSQAIKRQSIQDRAALESNVVATRQFNQTQRARTDELNAARYAASIVKRPANGVEEIDPNVEITDDDKKQIKDINGSMSSLLGQIGEIIELRGDAGNWASLPGKTKQDIRSRALSLMQAIAVAQGAGAIGAEEAERFKEIIGNPDRFEVFLSATGELESLQKNFLGQLQRKLKAYNVRPTAQHYRGLVPNLVQEKLQGQGAGAGFK